MTELTLESTRELLFDATAEFREIGIQQLLKNIPDSSSLAIDYLLNCPEAQLSMYADNLTRYLPFLRNCFAPPSSSRAGRYRTFAKLAREFDIFIDSIDRIAAGLPRSDRDLFLTRLAVLPGIHNEVRKTVEGRWGRDQADRFTGLVEDTKRKRSTRQLMLFLTYECSLRCPYCFASDLLERPMPVDQALQFISQSHAAGIEMITFCGGEPTIYSHFPRLLDEIRERKMKTYFSTNLLAGPGVLERLTPDYVCSLIVHVAHKHVYGTNQWHTFKQNMGTVRDHDVPVGLRVNIYRDDHDWTHLFRLAKTFNLRDVQLAFAFPNITGSNKHVDVEQIKALIPGLIRFMDQCERADLRTVFSKPIPLCLFPKQLGETLVRRIEHSPSCSVFEDNFTHNVCVSPEGNVSPCLGMMGFSRPFAGFSDWRSIKGFCRSHILPALSAPVLPQCSDCFLWHRRVCQGLCLAHKGQSGGLSCH